MTTPLQAEFEQSGLTELQSLYEQETAGEDRAGVGDIALSTAKGLGRGAVEAVTGLPHFVGEVAKSAGKFTAGTFLPMPLDTRMRLLKESAEFPLSLARAMFVQPPENVYKVWQGLRSGTMSDEEALGILEETAAGAGVIVGGGLLAKGAGKAIGKLAPKPIEIKPAETPATTATPAVGAPAAVPETGADVVAQLDKLKVETAARNEAASQARMKAGQTWFNLSPNVRKVVFKGLSDAEYQKAKLKELSEESREIVYKTLTKDAVSDSPVNQPSVAAPAAGAPSEAPVPAPAPEGLPAETAPAGPPSVEPASREAAIRKRLEKKKSFREATPEKQAEMIQSVMSATEKGMEKALAPMTPERAKGIAAEISKEQEGTVGHIEPEVAPAKVAEVVPGKVVGEIKPVAEAEVRTGSPERDARLAELKAERQKLMSQDYNPHDPQQRDAHFKALEPYNKEIASLEMEQFKQELPEFYSQASKMSRKELMEASQKLNIAEQRDPQHFAKNRILGFFSNKLYNKEVAPTVEPLLQAADELTAFAERVREEGRTELAADYEIALREGARLSEVASRIEAGEIVPAEEMQPRVGIRRNKIAPAEPAPAPPPAGAPEAGPETVSRETPAEPTPAPEARPAPPPAEPVGRTLLQVEFDRDALIDSFDKGQIPAAQFTQQMNTLMAEMKALKPAAEPKAAPTKPSGKVRAKSKEELRYQELVGQPIKQMSDTDLTELRQLLDEKITLEGGPKVAVSAAERVKRVVAELGAREARREREGGFIRPHRKQVKVRPDTELQPYERILKSSIKTDYVEPTVFGFKDAFLRVYNETFRKAAGIGSREKIMLRGKRVDTWNSPYKLAQMLDRSIPQTMEFLTGDGPFLPDGQGGFVRTGTRSLQKIVNDMEAIKPLDYWDMLWGSLHELETRAISGGTKTIGLDPVAAQQMVANATPGEISLIREAVAFNRDLAKFAHALGYLSSESLASFSTNFYGPKSRIFEDMGDGSITDLASSGKTVISTSTPFKRVTGSRRPMRGFIESSIDMAHRVVRKSNLNDVGQQLIKIAKGDLEAARGYMRPVDPVEYAKIKKKFNEEAAAYVEDAKRSGVDVSKEEARLKVDTDARELNITNGILRAYVDGKLEAWYIDPVLARSLGSLRAPDLPMFWRLLGLPAGAVHFGIVNDPTFIMSMAFVDQFQGFINSKYGFIPGIDGFKGWWNIVTNSPKYREFQTGGGAGMARTYGRFGKSQEIQLRDVARQAQSTLLGEALQQIKEVRLFEAYKTLANPMEQATRVGEYLLARGGGNVLNDFLAGGKRTTASVIDGVYAARNITVNYHNIGASVHGIAHAVPFLNAGMQNFDKLARNIGERSGPWAIKSALVALMTYYLWQANADDQEITDLRQTPEGARYWYIRDADGRIYRMRKTYFEGAVFGTGVEAVLDKMTRDDPQAMKLWRESILKELQIGALPPPVEAFYALSTGVDRRTGMPLVPEGAQHLAPALQFGTQTGRTAKELGGIFNVSPAKMEYVFGTLTGRLGVAGIRLVDALAEYKQHDELPPADELPFISQIAVRSPKTNVRPLREFYDNAMKAEEVSNSVAWYIKHDPDKLAQYVEANKEGIFLANTLAKPRKEIADLRRAMMDLKEAPSETLTAQEKREYTDHFLRMMIEIARAANLTTNAIKYPPTQATAR